MLEVECDINCLFIYYQVYVLIALLLSYWHSKEWDLKESHKKTNYILLNLLPMLTHSVFSKNAIRKVISFLNFKIVEI